MTVASPLAHARVRLVYGWRHRRLPALTEPRLFTEWVQHRKLYNRDDRLPPLTDKVAVKAFVAERLGPEWLIPTLWHGRVLPVAAPAPLPLVVKARHGCGQIAFVHEADGWPALRTRTRRWMRARYGYWLDEWAYAHVPRGLLVEPYVGEGSTLPIDYKCFVFGGRVEFVQVHLDRAGTHRWIVMDRDWRRVSVATADPDPAPPGPRATRDARADHGRGRAAGTQPRFSARRLLRGRETTTVRRADDLSRLRPAAPRPR